MHESVCYSTNTVIHCHQQSLTSCENSLAYLFLHNNLDTAGLDRDLNYDFMPILR
jgi:hypothetical protein